MEGEECFKSQVQRYENDSITDYTQAIQSKHTLPHP